jgi:hypothetical protein
MLLPVQREQRRARSGCRGCDSDYDKVRELGVVGVTAQPGRTMTRVRREIFSPVGTHGHNCLMIDKLINKYIYTQYITSKAEIVFYILPPSLNI